MTTGSLTASIEGRCIIGKSAPKPPDPKETAAASTSTNVGSAIANAFMGNISEYGPDGSTRVEATGEHKWVDPYTGQSYTIPTFSRYTELSEAQQAIKNQSDAAELNLAGLANQQSGFLQDYLAKPFNLSGAPAAGDSSAVGLPDYQAFGNGPALATGIGSAGSIQNSIGKVGKTQTDLKGAGSIQNSLGKTGAIQSNIASGGAIQRGIGGAGDITRSYETDFSADRQRVEDALMARMNPQLDRDRAALEQRLANQGLQPGSQAYNRAIDEANRSATEARYGAILGAGQEQSRLVGLANQAASFQNSAQQQAYDQLMGAGQFANAAQAQQYGQNANDAAFANSAQAQRLQKALAEGGFKNAAQQQNYNQILASGQFANAARQQRFDQEIGKAGLANAAQQQMYDQEIGKANLQNNAMQQMADNAYRATAGNNAQQDQSFNAQMAQVSAQNAARTQWMQEQFAARSQPINEITALLSGGQVSHPTFMGANMPQIPTTDVAGLINTNYAQQMQGYQAKQQALGGLLGGVGSLVGTFLSDDNAKKDKTRLGDVKGEMGLWSYRYKGEPKTTPKHVGLMASEVEREKPSAIKRKDGLRYVNYPKALGGK